MPRWVSNFLDLEFRCQDQMSRIRNYLEGIKFRNCFSWHRAIKRISKSYYGIVGKNVRYSYRFSQSFRQQLKDPWYKTLVYHWDNQRKTFQDKRVKTHAKTISKRKLILFLAIKFKLFWDFQKKPALPGGQLIVLTFEVLWIRWLHFLSFKETTAIFRSAKSLLAFWHPTI